MNFPASLAAAIEYHQKRRDGEALSLTCHDGRWVFVTEVDGYVYTTEIVRETRWMRNSVFPCPRGGFPYVTPPELNCRCTLKGLGLGGDNVQRPA